ncbi:hypothetical protein K439DRAFT_1377659, partial [Ramaria rubella]
EYLQGLFKFMNPYLLKNSVLIMDNCSTHHVEGVAELCQERYVSFCLFHGQRLLTHH